MVGVVNLIAKIVEYHRPRDLLSHIESLPPSCRPRAYLASLVRQLPYDDADIDAESLELAIHYLFLIFGPYEAMIRCCELRALEDLLRYEMNENRFDHLTSDLREVVERTLQAFSISDVGEPSRLLSPLEVVRRIAKIDQERGQAVDAQRFDLLQAQGSTINAWTLVESVLKLSMGYFGLHFANSLPPKLFKSFRDALRRGSLGNVTQVMKSFEAFFKEGELPSEAKTRRRRTSEELNEIADDEERAKRRNELETEEKQIQEINRQRAKQLQSDCWQYFGRRSPFERVDFTQYQQIFSLQRNPFAHRPIDQLLGTSQDWGRIRECLRDAKEIVESLRDARVVPRIIVIWGSGTDNYGNRMVWFTDRREKEKLVNPRKLEWMYTTSDVNFKEFQQVAMLTPDSDQIKMEPLIDPASYPIQEIEDFFKARELQ